MAMPWVYAKCKLTVEIDYQYEFLRSVECCKLPGSGLDVIGADILRLVPSGTIFEKKNCSVVSKVLLNPQLKLGSRPSQQGFVTTLETCGLK